MGWLSGVPGSPVKTPTRRAENARQPSRVATASVTRTWGSDSTVLCKNNRAKSGAEEAATAGPPWRDVRGATSLCPLTACSARRGQRSRAAAAGKGPCSRWHSEEQGQASAAGLEGWSGPIRQTCLEPGFGAQPRRLLLGGSEPSVMGQNPASGAGAGTEQEEETSWGRGAGVRGRQGGLSPPVLQPGRPEPRLTLLPFLSPFPVGSDMGV